MKRGRPKGRSSDTRSFGPLGDLIRKHRLARGMGLLDVAKACDCSVQFVSNIEHGRAPLPWEKVAPMAAALKIATSDLQAANLAIRSDFQNFVTENGKNGSKPTSLSKKAANFTKMTGAASVLAIATRDSGLTEIIQKYQLASPATKKKFVRSALQLLT